MKRTQERIREIIESVNGESTLFQHWQSNSDDITEPRKTTEHYYSALSEDTDKVSPLFTIAVFGYSDYSGSTVEQSNYAVWNEEYAKYKGRLYFCVYGGYGSHTILFDARYISDEMIDTLQGLVDYPLINDEALSFLELEIETEYVNDNILPIINAILEDHDIENYADTFSIYRAIMEETNTYPIFETGGICYIDEDIFTEERILSAYRSIEKDKQEKLTGQADLFSE